MPVPWPYLFDARSDIFGWPYVLMPRMPGLQLSDPGVVAQLRREDRAGIAGELRANLAAMQALTCPFPVPGEHDADTRYHSFPYPPATPSISVRRSSGT